MCRKADREGGHLLPHGFVTVPWWGEDSVPGLIYILKMASWVYHSDVRLRDCKYTVLCNASDHWTWQGPGRGVSGRNQGSCHMDRDEEDQSKTKKAGNRTHDWEVV